MATRHTPRRRHGMRAAAVAFVLATALTACKKGEGGPGEAQAKEPEVEAIPVEVVKAANRPIAASYTGTAALEPLAQALLSGRIVPGKKLVLGADSNGLTMSQP